MNVLKFILFALLCSATSLIMLFFICMGIVNQQNKAKKKKGVKKNG